MGFSISPASLQNAVAQLEATRNKERDGLLNAPGKLITDLFSKTGKHLDQAVADARGALNDGLRDGSLSVEEAQRVQSALVRGQLESTHYQNAKERGGNIVGGLIMGLPLMRPAAVAVTAAKAAFLNVTAHGVFEGWGYSVKDAAKDAAVGAATMGVAAKMFRPGQSTMRQAVVANGTSNAVFAGMQQALRDDNWSQGVGLGAAKTAAAVGIGAVIGGALGAGGHALHSMSRSGSANTGSDSRKRS